MLLQIGDRSLLQVGRELIERLLDLNDRGSHLEDGRRLREFESS